MKPRALSLRGRIIFKLMGGDERFPDVDLGLEWIPWNGPSPPFIPPQPNPQEEEGAYRRKMQELMRQQQEDAQRRWQQELYEQAKGGLQTLERAEEPFWRSQK